MTYGDTGAPSLWPFYSFHSAAPLLTQSHFYSGASTFPVTEMDATISLQNFDILSFDLPPFDCPLDGLHPVSSSSSLFDGDDTDFGPLPVNKFALLFENSILRLCKPLHCRLHDEVFELGLEQSVRLSLRLSPMHTSQSSLRLQNKIAHLLSKILTN
jgi:hypothetical protein